MTGRRSRGKIFTKDTAQGATPPADRVVPPCARFLQRSFQEDKELKKGIEKKHVTVALPLPLYDRLTALAAETVRTRPGYTRWVLYSWIRGIDEKGRGTD